MWQWVLVALIVAASAAYAAWALLPAATRLRLAGRLAAAPAPFAALGQRLTRASRPLPKTGADCDACPHSRVGTGSPQRPPPS